MKRKLNLIASLTSVVLAGLAGTSHAFQDHQSYVGSGVLEESASIAKRDDRALANVSPMIVKSPRKILSQFKPLSMPKRGRQAAIVQETGYDAALERPAKFSSNSTKTAQTSWTSDVGLKHNQTLPPVISGTAHRISQAAAPPVKAPSKPTEPSRPVKRSPAAESAVQSVAYYAPQGSATRVPLPQAGGAELPLPPVVSGSSSRAALPSGGGSSSSRATLPPVSGSDSRGALPPVESVLDNPQPPVDSGGSSSRGVSQDYFANGAANSEAPVIDDGTATGPITASPQPGEGFNNGPVIEDFGTFGSVSASRCYVHAEALLYTRADGDISAPNIVALNDFDFGPGLRLTLGRKSDSISGRELGFFALTDIDEDSLVTNSPFIAEDFQEQSKESSLYSIEYNRVNWGWDLVKTYVGVKYLRFEDSYQLLAADPIPANNSFQALDASNNLIGAHVGGELFYDIGYRWSGSIGGKYGIFANFNEFEATNGVANGPLFSSDEDNGTISTIAELNFLAHYQIRTNLRFQVGYNLLFIGNVATVEDNFTQAVPSLNGIEATDSDDVFFHGLSFGLEFYR